MEFGRIEGDVGRVDFSLPPEPSANADVLARAASIPARERGVVRFGLAGWSDRDFAGVLVPPGTPASEFLKLHARAYTTNELNTTYYGIDAARIERWRSATPASFRFCPKLPAEVTHGASLVGVESVMERFVELVREFGGRLGRAWGLLPIEFSPAQGPALEAFVRRWARELPLAFEVRGDSWYRGARAGQNADFERLCALFEEHDVALVLSDVAGRRDVCHMRVTARDAIVRFVGNRPHPSDAVRIEAWAERIAQWCDAGLQTAHVFVHQRRDPEAVDTTRTFRAAIRRCTGVDPLPDFPSEAEVARPVQGSLF